MAEPSSIENLVARRCGTCGRVCVRSFREGQKLQSQLKVATAVLVDEEVLFQGSEGLFQLPCTCVARCR